MCGALVGFLPWNFPNARAFLGDAGSHLVGYLLAVMAILPHFYTKQNPRPLAVLSPLLVLAMPLADLAWVVVLRTRAGKPFWIVANPLKMAAQRLHHDLHRVVEILHYQAIFEGARIHQNHIHRLVCFPFGGYVKRLGEMEQRHQAIPNRQYFGIGRAADSLADLRGGDPDQFPDIDLRIA